MTDPRESNDGLGVSIAEVVRLRISLTMRKNINNYGANIINYENLDEDRQKRSLPVWPTKFPLTDQRTFEVIIRSLDGYGLVSNDE